MDKERFEGRQRAEGRRVEPIEVKFGRQRHEAQLEQERERRLGKVRRELAGVMPDITIVLPAPETEKQGVVPEPKPEKKTLGAAFVEWVIGGLGLLLALGASGFEKARREASGKS